MWFPSCACWTFLFEYGRHHRQRVCWSEVYHLVHHSSLSHLSLTPWPFPLRSRKSNKWSETEANFWTISPYQSSHHKFMWKLKNSEQNGQAKLSLWATNSGFLRAGIYYRWHLVNIFTYLLNKSFLFRKICWSCIQHVRNISFLALLLGKNKTPLKTKEKYSSAER